jgi:TusA-related sulfurtransferase
LTAGAAAVEGGDLPLGGGLLALIRPALRLLEPGGVLTVLSSNAALRDDLPAWCKIEKHDYLGVEALERDIHRVRRGGFGVPRPFAEGDPTTGFAPPGAWVEPGGPPFPFTLLDRGRAEPPEARELYEQAVEARWSAEHDVPWSTVKPLPPALEGALGQALTFLAENELSALYVPSNFLPKLHPAFVDTAMFLATQLSDEARHIDVFLRRAGTSRGVSSVTTSQSLLSLLELRDFTEAAFLLSVLGEGTFLDLLKFIERFAPDEATAVLAARARADETRHVHFGMAHVRHALAGDPGLYARLEAAVRKRAATLSGAAGVPAPIADALTVLAARGTDPAALRSGHQAFRELLHTMAVNRARRLETAGFTPEQARVLADLHTPNFM